MTRSYVLLSMGLWTWCGCTWFIEERFDTEAEGSSAGGGGAAHEGSSVGGGGAAPIACPTPRATQDSHCPEVCDECLEDASVCVIACDAEKSCKAETVVCPPGMDCRISCDGESACQSATIACSAGYACEIECSGRNACTRASVACGEAASCALRCSDDVAVCAQTELSCGVGACSCSAGDASDPIQDCGASCACEVCQ